MVGPTSERGNKVIRTFRIRTGTCSGDNNQDVRSSGFSSCKDSEKDCIEAEKERHSGTGIEKSIDGGVAVAENALV